MTQRLLKRIYCHYHCAIKYNPGTRICIIWYVIANSPLGNFGNFISPRCQCLSEDTLKAVGHFHLMSRPGKVKHPTLEANV